MNRIAYLTPAWLAPACLALAACQSAGQSAGQSAAPNAAGAAVDTHEEMVRWINPASLAIWDVGNAAMSDTGGLDPALMDAAAWAKLRDAAGLLQDHSQRMAQAAAIRVGAHNDALEGFATRAEIQAMIDADPATFRRMSAETADHAAELLAAARTQDLEQAAALIETLSERCSACHSRYWEKPAG